MGIGMDALLHDLDAFALRLAQRQYRRAGIEMFLVLEDLQPTTADPLPLIDASGQPLAALVEAVALRRLPLQQDDPVRALQAALEIVATYDFGQAHAPTRDHLDPSVTGEDRLPLRLPSAVEPGAAALVRAIRAGRFIRTVNYHNTFAVDREQIRAQLTRLAARFQTIDLHELAALVAGNPWPHARPPLLLFFYEGFRNHYDVAAPLLAELGLKGIFCLIPGFNDAPSSTQFAFGLTNYIDVEADEYADPRLAMSWAEVRALARQGHAFVCHTMNHTSNDLADATLAWEIGGAVDRMEWALSQKVTAFVWLRGPEWGVEPRADHFLQQAGVQLLISNFKVQRIPP
jgi:peptidoglycan/xylan/chitin deacetylase (PgdA/CDA1 family)